MRVLVVAVLVGFGFLFGQEDLPERPRRQRRQRPPFGPERRAPRTHRLPTLAMEIDGNFAYVLIGTTLYKINLETMETSATCELQEEKGKEAATVEDLIKQFDRDGDGKISREEWRGPGGLFDRLDRNGDGTITPDEIPEKLLEIFKRRFAPKTPPLPAIIRFTKDCVIILLGNTLFKIRKSDLLIVGQTKLKPKKRKKKEEPAPEKPKEEPAPPKKEKNDFGF